METLGLIRHLIHRLLLAYGTLFLAAGPGVGALVLGATLLDPPLGLLGLAAGLAAVGTRAWVRLPALAGEGRCSRSATRWRTIPRVTAISPT